MSDNKGNSLYIQGSILAAASIISRLLGLIFRFPLGAIIGDQGNGVYSNAYEIYNMALLLSTYGIPVAVSRLVSAKETQKQYKNSYKIFKVAMIFSAIIGMIAAVIVFIFAEPLSIKLFKSPSSAIPLRFLAPTVFVFAIMGVLRGFFQGKNTMIPTAISQILEQIVHVICGLVFALIFMKNYADTVEVYAYGAAGGTVGTLTGAVAGLLFLLFIYIIYKPTLSRRMRRDRSGVEDTFPDLFKLLLITIIPIILNQLLYSITGTLDSVLFNNILDKKGIPEDERLTLIGIYSTKFRLLTNVPLAISAAIGVAVLPNVVKAYTSGSIGSLHEKVGQSVKLNMMIAFPAAAGLIALSRPIIKVCFRQPDGVVLEYAVILMLIGGLSVVFFAYSTTTNSILQGIGKLNKPIIHAAIGIIVYLLVDWPLLSKTTLGVFVLPIGYMVFPFIVSILNWYSIHKETGYRQEITNTFVKPALFSAMMGILGYFVYVGLSKLIPVQSINLLLTVALSVIFYAALMILTRTISKEELVELPLGNKVIGLLLKMGIKM